MKDVDLLLGHLTQQQVSRNFVQCSVVVNIAKTLLSLVEIFAEDKISNIQLCAEKLQGN